MELEMLLADAVARRASDVHFISGEPPIFRVNGALERQSANPLLSAVDIASLVLPLLAEPARLGLQNGTQSKAKAMVDVKAAPEYSFQISAYRAEGGIGAAVNILGGKIPALTDIAADALPSLDRIAALKRGLVLFTGPIGSGKNTTSAAVTDAINRSRDERIYIIGDTSGYKWRNANSYITTLAIGSDYESYESAAEAIFGGADPDVVLFAELPTPEAAMQAFILADTGHLVIATLSAGSAADAVAALVGKFTDPHAHAQDLLARTLVAVFNQQLLVAASGRGRLPAYETLFVTPEVRAIIRDGASAERLFAAIEQADDPDTRSLASAIDALVASGKVTEEVASQHRTRPMPA